MADSAGQGFVLPPGQGRSIDLGNFAMSVKATAEQTGGHFSLLEATEPAGFGPPLHVHRDASESFYVLEGEYTVFLGQRQFTCPAGSFIFMPAGTPHSFRVSAEAAESSSCLPLPRWLGISTISARRSMRAGPTRRRCPPSPPSTRWRCSGRCQRVTCDQTPAGPPPRRHRLVTLGVLWRLKLPNRNASFPGRDLLSDRVRLDSSAPRDRQ
jgi:quercetin dioxygenase-like cupin family protein